MTERVGGSAVLVVGPVKRDPDWPLFWRCYGTDPLPSDRPGGFLRITLPLPAMHGNVMLEIRLPGTMT